MPCPELGRRGGKMHSQHDADYAHRDYRVPPDQGEQVTEPVLFSSDLGLTNGLDRGVAAVEAIFIFTGFLV